MRGKADYNPDMPELYSAIIHSRKVYKMNLSPQETNAQPEHQEMGGVKLELYRTRTADGVELAVSRIRPRTENARLIPVVLIHGTYCTRSFWVSSKGIGMGAYLAEQGFDVWIPELRGHGLSPKGPAFSGITAEDQIRHDLPAIQRFVHQLTKTPAFWIGHSFGGLFIIAALGMKWIDQDAIKGMITFGSQISLGDRYLKIPLVAWGLMLLLKLWGHLPAPKLGLGPEIEPAGVIMETIRWKKLFGRWTDSKGRSYWEGLKNVRIPVMTFAAANDKNDPAQGCRIMHDHYSSKDSAFIILGKQHGFSKDYDHVGMVVSKEAQMEVWPKIAGWMKDKNP